MLNEISSPEEELKKKKESQIPVLSPTHFKRTGSLKLRNEMRIPHKTPMENSSTPVAPLRRHRSLVRKYLSISKDSKFLCETFGGLQLISHNQTDAQWDRGNSPKSAISQ